MKRLKIQQPHLKQRKIQVAIQVSVVKAHFKKVSLVYSGVSFYQFYEINISL